MNSIPFQFRYDLLAKEISKFNGMLTDNLLDFEKYGLRIIIQLAHRFLTYLEQIAVVSDPDAKKLIQITTIYGQEFQPFQKRYIGIFSLLQDPVIEGEPAYITVNEAIRFKSCFLDHELAKYPKSL